MAKNCIVIQYEIHDGYIGGSRPQHLRLNEDDVLDMRPGKIEDDIHDLTYEDALQKISLHIKNMDEVIDWIKAVQAKHGEEE